MNSINNAAGNLSSSSRVSIPELLHEYETRLLKDKLIELPGRILKKKAVIRDAREVYNNAAQDIAMLEANLAVDIAAETDPNTGKAKYSNDKMRQAELMRRKAAEPECSAAALRLKEAERRLGGLQDELEALQDKFKAYRYVVRLTAEELALLASEEQEEKIEGVSVAQQPY